MSIQSSPATEIFPIVSVRDLSAAVAFYCDLLGFHMTYRWPTSGELEFAYLTLGATGLGLGTLGGRHAQTGAVFATGGVAPVDLCLYVNDLDSLLASLAAAGHPTVAGPIVQPWGERTAYVTDPAGIQLLLIQSPDR